MMFRDSMSPEQGKNFFGDAIRRRREALGISVEELSRQTQIPQKYILAFENGKLGFFSAKVYAAGYLNKILAAISVENKDELIKEFNEEWLSLASFQEKEDAVLARRPLGRIFSFTPRRLSILAAGIALFVLLLFFGYRLMVFVRLPPLIIEMPRDKIVQEERIIKIKGGTERESRLTVNGREIKINESGIFEDEIEAIKGVNVLEFVAEDRFGKQTKEIRHVLVK